MLRMRPAMRRLSVLTAAAALLGAATAALTDADLVRKHNCVACHSNERKMVGPAFKDIADRYAADKDAAGKLAARIRAGGSGAWGPMPMPPQPQVSEADALALARHVLTIKPSS